MKKKVWGIWSLIVVPTITVVLLTVGMWLLDARWFFALTAVSVAALIYALARVLVLRRDVRHYLSGTCETLSLEDRNALAASPFSVLLLSELGEIVWYNDRFRQSVLSGKDIYGDNAEDRFEGLSIKKLSRADQLDVYAFGKAFSVYKSTFSVDAQTAYVLYFIDDTELKAIAEEYAASRPVVLSLYIDNSEEIMQTFRDSEKAQLLSQAETLLEDWITEYNGLFRKYSGDRFIAVIEYRYLSEILERKFDILDKIRTIQTTKGESLTLSVGVGTGQSFFRSELRSRQALDMALGRGGNQAAVKTENGYDFYGGLTQSVERQTRVRSRVVASALKDMILSSDVVLLMGHRYSDLDCLGSAAALAVACRSLGKAAYVVYDPATTLAEELVLRFSNRELFITQQDALPLVTSETLLVITDTHTPAMLDIPQLYQQVSTVVVIDHHRKMVGHIDDAVIFYHEPYSSSASEMVAELIQYMPDADIGKTEAEALLGGIMLDTRGFVIKAGVRTFEAAAYLKKIGADTVQVKRLFSENISLYQEKAEIISTAEWYKNTAIAYAPNGGKQVRVAASQAADELLFVKDAYASFAMFEENGGVNISARSCGALNVQLVMESLGGGGHQTMAGAFLKDTDLSVAELQLKRAIDAVLLETEKSHSLKKRF